MESSDSGDLICLPNGTRIIYRDSDHSYWRCKPDGKRGKRLTGVTSVVRPLDFRPDSLMRWAVRTNAAGIAQLAEESADSSWLLSAERIHQALEGAGLTYEQVREEAARTGTNVHRLAFAALAEGRPTPDYSKMTQDERAYTQGVVQFWLDHSPAANYVEQVVADETMGVAGRFDFHGLIMACSQSGCPCKTGTALIDAKTGSGYISVSAHAQIAFYDYLALHSLGTPSADQLLILKLADDGSYKLVEVHATHEDAFAALDTYRRAARIGSAARKARKRT